MKRPTGVTFSAIILLMGSLLHVVMAIGMALSGAVVPAQNTASIAGNPPRSVPMPSWAPLMMYIMGAFFLGLAVWGFLTAIGLFRLRPWARYSALVIGGCLAFFGLISVLSTLVMLALPVTPPPGADASLLNPDQAHTMQIVTKLIFAVLAFLYAIVSAIGVSWLVYFNRKTAREAFAGQIPDTTAELLLGATVKPAPARRPVLIVCIAVLNMIGAASVLLTLFLPIPALAFGFIVYGWAKVAIYLAVCCLQAAVGIGLWRMREWGRRLTLGLMALGLVQSAFYAFRPSLIARYNAEVYKLAGPMPALLPARFQSILFCASMGFSILFCIAIAAILIHYRRAFQPVAPPSSVSADA